MNSVNVTQGEHSGSATVIQSVRVLVATGLYPPDIGGPATYATMLEEVLPPQDIEVTVLPFGSVRQYPKGVRHVIYAWRLWRHARSSDLVYALDPVSVGLPACLVSFITRRPFLVRLGGDYAWEQGQQRFGLHASLDVYAAEPANAPVAVRVLAFVQRLVVRRAKRVIVPSEYLKGIVVRWGVDANSISVIYSVLFPIAVPQEKTALQEQLQFTYPTIVTAGRLVPWKGFAAVIDAVTQLNDEFPNLTVVIVGDGPDAASLQAQVEEHGLSEQVRFTGRLGKTALGATIKAADVFVLNTAYEGLSHQLLEVMDLGVPIVTTPVGGNPELIDHESTGLLVEQNDVTAIADAIARLVNDAALSERLAAAAKAHTALFERHRISKQTAAVIHAVANSV